MSKLNGNGQEDEAEVERRYEPPTFGAPQRDAIGAVIDGICMEMSRRFADLRRKIDAAEQSMLANAAASKSSFNGHIDSCAKIGDEISRVSALVDELSAMQADATAALVASPRQLLHPPSADSHPSSPSEPR